MIEIILKVAEWIFIIVALLIVLRIVKELKSIVKMLFEMPAKKLHDTKKTLKHLAKIKNND